MKSNLDITQRAISGLKYLFVADAIAMPVHWYYRIADIFTEFPGGISKLENAPSFHPGSIMSLHSTLGGGRNKAPRFGKVKEVVGAVILKDKAELQDATHELARCEAVRFVLFQQRLRQQ